MSLRTKLLLMLGSLLAATILIVLLTLQYLQSVNESQMTRDALRVLHKRSTLLVASIGEARQTLELVGAALQRAYAQPGDFSDAIQALNGRHLHFERFAFDTLDGYTHPHDGPPFSIRARSYFPDIQQGKPVTTLVQANPGAAKPALLLTVPLYDRQQRLVGALEATQPVNLLLNQALRDLPGRGMALIAFDRQGRMLDGEVRGADQTSSAPSAALEVVASAVAVSQFATAAESSDASTERSIAIDGVRHRVTTLPIPDMGWQLAYVQPEASRLELVQGTRWLAWGMLLTLAMVTVAIILIAQRHVLAPLRILHAAQTRVREGDLTARALVDGNDELAELATSFNHMVEALQMSEEKFRVVFEAFPYPVVLTRVLDNRFLDVNPAFAMQTGTARQDVVGRTLQELGATYDSAVLDRHKVELLTAGQLDGKTMQMSLPDGRTLWNLYSSRLVQIDGDLVAISVTTDISALKAVEASLKESEAAFTALFQLAPIPLSFVGEDGDFSTISRNEAWHNTFGYTQDDSDRLTGNDAGIWTDLAERKRYIAQAIAEGQVMALETHLRRRDGSIRDCVIHGRFIHAGGRRVLMTAYLDVTEARQAERELRELNDRLLKQNALSQAISRAQTEFIVKADLRQAFDSLLADMLALTQSEFGFIGEILHANDGAPYIKARSITNIAWDEATRRYYEDNAPSGIEFHNLKTLFGTAVTTGRTVISNSPASDPRRGGLPPGHPAMQSFIALPIHVGGQIVALACMANRPGGYDTILADWLHPLLATTGQLIEARRTEAARAVAEKDAQRFRYMVDHANDAIFLMDGMTIVECNPAALTTFGCTREQFIGRTPVDFSPPEQADGRRTQETAQHLIDSALAGDALRFEWRHRRADGTPFVAEVELGSFTEDGTTRVLAILRDITERKQIEAEVRALAANLEDRVASRTGELAARNAELAQALSTLEVARARLAENEQRLRNVMTATGEGFWDWNIRNDQLYTSPRWCEILGYSPDDTEHEIDFFARRLLDDERKAVMGAVQDCLEGKGPLRVEHRVRRRDGSTLWVLDRGDIAERGSDGKPARMVGSISNITDRKEAELALAEAKAVAEAANAELAATLDDLRRAQDELVRTEKLASLGALVAGVAHELNTPIGNAVTVSSTLLDEHRQFLRQTTDGLTRSALTSFVDAVGEAGEILERNLNRAAELVGGFKQLAVDQSSYQKRPFDLDEVVHEIALAMAPAVRKAGCSVSYTVAPGLLLDSYPGPLGQVLMNLINNALLHAFEGRAPGSIAVEADMHEAGWIELAVRDDGRGISAEHQRHIFDPFFTTRLGQGGSGLGLHIVFNLVTDLLGGRIRVDSTPGAGATFVVRIPAVAPPPKTRPDAAEAEYEPRGA